MQLLRVLLSLLHKLSSMEFNRRTVIYSQDRQRGREKQRKNKEKSFYFFQIASINAKIKLNKSFISINKLFAANLFFCCDSRCSAEQEIELRSSFTCNFIEGNIFNLQKNWNRCQGRFDFMYTIGIVSPRLHPHVVSSTGPIQ